ncbi:hypothetical protein GCM10027425_12060 [Alteromonas gracilis]
MSRASVPFHCPFCGETDLYPREDGWDCRACTRGFAVRLLGAVRPPASPADAVEAGESR